LRHVERHDELRQPLLVLKVWKEIEQHIIDNAVDQWRDRLAACVREEVDILSTQSKNSSLGLVLAVDGVEH